ncbi:TPA: type II toxin-antitoxin system VapC family toxin [Candidatus Bathyarchaeota archaeon]|nr:type II toxin-antitoxin system VapC family toxin [Candidatus Bathyarchaeota archaeon]
MRVYVSDAVAFLYFLLDRLPPMANDAFGEAEKGEAVLYLPTIAAAELHYLFAKKGWLGWWDRLRARVSESPTFQYYPFNEQVLSIIDKTKAGEIHDRIIISTTKLTKANALITKDEELRKLREVKTIWS